MHRRQGPQVLHIRQQRGPGLGGITFAGNTSYGCIEETNRPEVPSMSSHRQTMAHDEPITHAELTTWHIGKHLRSGGLQQLVTDIPVPWNVTSEMGIDKVSVEMQRRLTGIAALV